MRLIDSVHPARSLADASADQRVTAHESRVAGALIKEGSHT